MISECASLLTFKLYIFHDFVYLFGIVWNAKKLSGRHFEESFSLKCFLFFCECLSSDELCTLSFWLV